MNPLIASRIPLVCRQRPPGAPLEERIAVLTAQAVDPGGAAHGSDVARAAGVFNFAALIASDTGLPDLAADLCWRQHRIFAEAGNLEPDIAVMALMPIVNIARLMIREGDGNRAFDILQVLYQAARNRGSALICGHEINLASLTQTSAGHRRVCEELWAALLIDGTRALAHAGRWTEAADIMARHRGIGNRLLDGRQVKIMALVMQDLTEQASAMIEATVSIEPWEDTVAALLRLGVGAPQQASLERVIDDVMDLMTHPEPTTAVFRTRIGLTALDLLSGKSPGAVPSLHDAIICIAASDAYAARDVIGHDEMRTRLTRRQEERLAATLATAGLGDGAMAHGHLSALTAAVQEAEYRLRHLL